jgi:hypothetical protein
MMKYGHSKQNQGRTPQGVNGIAAQFFVTQKMKSPHSTVV